METYQRSWFGLIYKCKISSISNKEAKYKTKKVISRYDKFRL